MNDVQDLGAALMGRGIQEFLKAQADADVQDLVLRKGQIMGIPSSIIADQIAGRRKAKFKLPLYVDTPGVIFPRGINLEQCSSEKTGVFKARLLASRVQQCKHVIDLSGGFGVDSFCLSRFFGHVHYVDPDQAIAGIAAWNHQCLGADNIEYTATDAHGFLKQTTKGVDAIFVDPSRRVATNKVYHLGDCSPDVRQLMSAMFNLTPIVVIKASPLLDLTQAVRELPSVSEIFVVSVNNECKEVLLFCKKLHEGEPVLTAVNLSDETEDWFSFTQEEERLCTSVFGPLETYLYEPNHSILKAGAFKLTGRRYGLKKLHVNTHLYTSAELISGFPGRVFHITGHVSGPTKLADILPEKKGSVVVRNFPATVEQLRAKYDILDGSAKYLFVTTCVDGKRWIACERIR
jgi:hypothetical protein